MTQNQQSKAFLFYGQSTQCSRTVYNILSMCHGEIKCEKIVSLWMSALRNKKFQAAKVTTANNRKILRRTQTHAHISNRWFDRA